MIGTRKRAPSESPAQTGSPSPFPGQTGTRIWEWDLGFRGLAMGPRMAAPARHGIQVVRAYHQAGPCRGWVLASTYNLGTLRVAYSTHASQRRAPTRHSGARLNVGRTPWRRCRFQVSILRLVRVVDGVCSVRPPLTGRRCRGMTRPRAALSYPRGRDHSRRAGEEAADSMAHSGCKRSPCEGHVVQTSTRDGSSPADARSSGI
jgi:hypothetical protein